MKTKILSITFCAMAIAASANEEPNEIPKSLVKRIQTIKRPGVTVTLLALEKTKNGTFALLRSTDGNFLSEEIFMIRNDGTGKTLAGDVSFDMMLVSHPFNEIPEETKKKLRSASSKEEPIALEIPKKPIDKKPNTKTETPAKQTQTKKPENKQKTPDHSIEWK